jgi:putative ABC transport system permease protein
MKTPLAWLNLVHRKGRSLAALAGVACVVVFGFLGPGLGGAEAPAGVYDALNFDLLLVSSQYVDFYHPGTLPRRIVSLAAGVPGVCAVMPVYVASALGLDPQRERPQAGRPMTVIGFDPDEPVFRPGSQVAGTVARFREALCKPDRVLVNRPIGGAEIELGARRVIVAGTVVFETDRKVALCRDTTLSLILCEVSPDRMAMGLVLLERGASAGRVAAALRSVLPPDVRVLTRREVTARARPRRAGVPGTLGMLVAIGVGLAFVYQAMASSVRSQLPEFATLLALGYTTRSLAGVVLRQVLLLAATGYVAGLAALAVLGAAGVPLEFTWQCGLAALAPAAVCGLPGLLAVWKLVSADPTELLEVES